MTVIAWDGITLAADKQAAGGENGHRVRLTKIFEIKQGFYQHFLFGYAGLPAIGLLMLDWLQDHDGDPVLLPEEQKTEDACEALLVSPTGEVFEISRYGKMFKIEESYAAIGSGAAFAMGAIYNGATAKLAVLTASALSSTCGMGVDTLIFKGE